MVTPTVQTRSGAVCDNVFGLTGAEHRGRDPRLSLRVSLSTHSSVLTKCISYSHWEGIAHMVQWLGCRLYVLGIVVQFPAETTGLSLLHNLQTCAGAHPTCYSVLPMDIFRKYDGRGVMLTTHPLHDWGWNWMNLNFRFHICLRTCTWTNLVLFYFTSMALLLSTNQLQYYYYYYYYY